MYLTVSLKYVYKFESMYWSACILCAYLAKIVQELMSINDDNYQHLIM